MMKLIAKQIHKGDKTHTQLQSITWQSFSTMKTIVRRPLNPMPPVDTFSDILLLIFLYFLNVIITSFLYGFWGQESFWRDRLRLLYSNFLLVDSLNLKTIFYQRYYFYRDFPIFLIFFSWFLHFKDTIIFRNFRIFFGFIQTSLDFLLLHRIISK